MFFIWWYTQKKQKQLRVELIKIVKYFPGAKKNVSSVDI